MKLIQLCLKNAMLMNLLTVMVIVVGVAKTIQMNKEAFPAVDFDIVAVSTHYPGASPRETELYVTDLLEDEIKTVDGLDRVESTSIEGHSLLIIALDPDRTEAQKNKTTNDIQRAVDRVRDLPDELPNPPLVTSMDSANMPVLELAISGPVSFSDLHQISTDLRDRLEDIDDVNEVNIRGERDREFWIEVDPKRIDRYNVGLSLIIASLQTRNINLPGGLLRSTEGEMLVRTMGEVKSIEEIENIVLRTNDAGIHVRLKDVASVRETFEEKKRAFRTNSYTSANLLVNKKASGDIIDLVDAVKAEAAAFMKQRDPEGKLEITYMNDMSIFVKNRLGVLLNNGYIGIALVLFTLLLFLSKGIAITAAAGMPVALFACLAVMGYMDITVNLISMFGLVIVLGMLVDDAIIVAENIWQHYERGETPWNAAVKGASEVFWPVTATILTTIAAFSPLMMISGIFGKFISFLPKVVIIALVASLVEAMFVLPAHAYDAIRFLDKGASKKHKEKNKRSFMEWGADVYAIVLNKVLRFRYVFFAGILSLLAGTAWFAKTHMELILFPSEGIESFFVRLELPRATPLSTTEKMLVPIETLIAELPKGELRAFTSHAGIIEDDPNDPFSRRGSRYSQIQVFLTPEKDRKRIADEIIEDLRQKIEVTVKETGHTKFYFSRIRTGPPIGKPVAIRLKGDDLDQLDDLSDKVQAVLGGIAGVSDIADNFAPGKDELQVIVDQKAASRNLLTVHDIALHVRTAIEGQIATHIRLEGERIATRVRFKKESRSKIDELKNSRILNQAGILVPLKRVAKLEIKPGVNAIIHHDFKRTVQITASLDESMTSSTSVNKEALPLVKEVAADYPEIQFEIGGEYEDTDESMESLQEAFGVAVGLIFLILATQFRSLTQPFVVMMAIPFGAIGVIGAFWAHNLPLSFLGLIGTIGLSGVVVNDSIVLVDFINKARDRGQAAFEACLYAGKRRFRAVWLTTMTTVLGLLPLVYGIGGEDMFLMPAAVALGYGLIFGTVLVLFLVPAVYMIRVDIGGLLLIVFPFARPWFKK